jgi:hypothetical protein
MVSFLKGSLEKRGKRSEKKDKRFFAESKGNFIRFIRFTPSRIFAC